MATGTLVSAEEYLETSYRPDREYVDGVVVERNVGEGDHSSLQMSLGAYLFSRRKRWNIRVLPEQRVQEVIRDSLAFGVAYVWVINPRTRRAFVHTAAGTYEAKDGILRTVNPELVVPLAEIFDATE